MEEDLAGLQYSSTQKNFDSEVDHLQSPNFLLVTKSPSISNLIATSFFPKTLNRRKIPTETNQSSNSAKRDGTPHTATQSLTTRAWSLLSLCPCPAGTPGFLERAG